MSEFVQTGRDAYGQPIYREDLTESEKDAEVRKSPEWEDFSNRFADSDANANLLTMADIDKLGTDSSVDERRGLLRNIIRSGGIISLRTIKKADGQVLLNAGQYEFEIRPAELEPAPEPEVPRDKNGRPLSEAQIRWSEYRQFTETHSSQDCKNRAKADVGFASFLRTNLRREMTEGGVGDAVENLNARPEEPKEKATPELLSWVAEYNRSSAEHVRKQKRADFNPLGYGKYNKNLEAAIAAGLI
jgi:hypothetical protein